MTQQLAELSTQPITARSRHHCGKASLEMNNARNFKFADIMLVGLPGTEKSIISQYAASHHGLIIGWSDIDISEDGIGNFDRLEDAFKKTPDLASKSYLVTMQPHRLMILRRNTTQREPATTDLNKIERHMRYSLVVADMLGIAPERRIDVSKTSPEDAVSIMMQGLGIR